MYYSKSYAGFVDGRDSIPDDAVLLSDDEYRSLLRDISVGKVIKSDENGCPIALERAPVDPTYLAVAARAERDHRLHDALAVLDRHEQQIRYSLLPTLTNDQARLWAIYAQALRDVPQQASFPTQIDWPTPPA
ncbi:phage tail assembly chaperone [Chromobacterium haemolyticum]|nr:phage tail assembly chaperone [Chromobacterium haemolyticum]